MKYENIISSSFEYAQEGLVGKWRRRIVPANPGFLQSLAYLQVFMWIFFAQTIRDLFGSLPGTLRIRIGPSLEIGDFVVSVLVVNGYVVKILSDTAPAPEIPDWRRLSTDSIKTFLISLVYGAPLILIDLRLVVPLLAGLFTGIVPDIVPRAGCGEVFVGVLLFFAASIIVSLILPVAVVRFAREGRIREAFGIRAILGHIGRIGWPDYVGALVILLVLYVVVWIAAGVASVMAVIPVVGWFVVFSSPPMRSTPHSLFLRRDV